MMTIAWVMVGVLLFVKTSFSTILEKPTPSPPTPATTHHETTTSTTHETTNADEGKCEAMSASGCEACVQRLDVTCVWCLASSSCVLNSTVETTCRFSSRRECCNTFTECELCTKRLTCGWCTGVGCRLGDEHGDIADYCDAASWTFNTAKCPIPQTTESAGAALLLGVAMVVGAFFVLLGGLMLVLFAVRSVQRNKAREALDRYARAVRRHATPCDRCHVVAAVWQCRPCNASFCSRCTNRVHARGPRSAHRVERLASVNAAAASAHADDAPGVYTSFAAILASIQDNPAPLLAEEVGLK